MDPHLQSYVPSKGDETPAPIRIVDFRNGSLVVHTDTLNQILRQNELTNNRPIALVTAVGEAGEPKCGKSFLLNYMVRFLKNGGTGATNWMKDGNPDKPLDGFHWNQINYGTSHHDPTPGIDIWPQPFLLDTNKSEILTVFLVDFSNEIAAEMLHDFALSICSSVIFIELEEVKAETLEKLVKTYQLLQENHCEMFKQAAFMVTNWSPDAADGKHKYGSEVGEIHLEKLLKRRSKFFQDPSMKLALENTMKHLDELSCHLLPVNPVLNFQNGTTTFDGRFSQLNKDFVKYFSTFISSVLLENLDCKRAANGDKVYPSGLVGIIEETASALNKNMKTMIPPSISPRSVANNFQQKSTEFSSLWPEQLLQPGSPVTKSKVLDPEARAPTATSHEPSCPKKSKSLVFGKTIDMVEEKTEIIAETAFEAFEGNGDQDVEMTEMTGTEVVSINNSPAQPSIPHEEKRHQFEQPQTQENLENIMPSAKCCKPKSTLANGPPKGSEEEYKIIKEAENVGIEKFKKELELKFSSVASAGTFGNFKLSDHPSVLEIDQALDVFKAYLIDHDVEMPVDSRRVVSKRLEAYFLKSLREFKERQRGQQLEQKIPGILQECIQRLRKYLAELESLPKLNELEAQIGKLKKEATNHFRQLCSQESISNPPQSFVQKFENEFDVTMQTFTEEHKEHFQALSTNDCDQYVQSIFDNYRRMFMDELQAGLVSSSMEISEVVFKQLHEQCVTRVKTTLSRPPELFAIFRSYFNSKINLLCADYRNHIRNFIEAFDRHIVQIEQQFKHYTCFTDENFNVKVGPIFTKIQTMSLHKDVKLEEFRDLLCSHYKRVFIKQNENIRAYELEISKEVEETIKTFYNDEMKNYTKSGYKPNLQDFHNGLVDNLMTAYKESCNLKEESSAGKLFLGIQINWGKFKHQLDSFFPKYKDDNEENLDMAKQKVSLLFKRRKQEYNDKMNEKMRADSFSEFNFRKIHEQLCNESRKLFSIDAKNLVADTKGDEEELLDLLSKDFARHSKANEIKWENDREKREKAKRLEEERLAAEKERIAEEKREEDRKRRERERNKKEEKERQERERREEAARKRKEQEKVDELDRKKKKAKEEEDRKKQQQQKSRDNQNKESSFSKNSNEQTRPTTTSSYSGVKIGIEFGVDRITAGFINSKHQLELIRDEFSGDEFVRSTFGVENNELQIGVEDEASFISLSNILLERSIKVDPITFGDVEITCFEELVGLLLAKVKRNIEVQANCQISEVLIAIPTWFTQEQRRGVKIGAELAGFDSVKLISELAAASFNLEEKCLLSSEEKVLFVKQIAFTTDKNSFEVALFDYTRYKIVMKKYDGSFVWEVPSSGVIKTVLNYIPFWSSSSAEDDAKKKAIKNVMGSYPYNFKHVIVLSNLSSENVKKAMEKLVNDMYCRNGLQFHYPNICDHFVLKGLTKIAFDSKAGFINECIPYELLSEVIETKKKATIYKSHSSFNSQSKDPHEFVPNGPVDLLVNELVQGQQLKLGAYHVRYPHENKKVGKFKFSYSLSVDGILSAEARFGNQTITPTWFGNNLEDCERTEATVKINRLIETISRQQQNVKEAYINFQQLAGAVSESFRSIDMRRKYVLPEKQAAINLLLYHCDKATGSTDIKKIEELTAQLCEVQEFLD